MASSHYIRDGRRMAAALALLILLATACTSAGADPETPAMRPDGVELPADAAAPGRIATPGQDVPNPFILVEEDRYLLYSSQTGIDSPNISLRQGPSLDRLGRPTETLPVLPDWANAAFNWAPDVRKIDDRYVMWFTARSKKGRPGSPRGLQCIGAAVADRAAGPFRPVGDGPPVCPLERWGAIDPRTFLDDDGSLWLHWKSDDNADVDGTTLTAIHAQRLAEDGITFLGPPTVILEPSQPWEGRIVEAPHMVEVDGRHWLFYSGNWFNQTVYAIGVAECDGPAGPCHKPFDQPWLASNAQGDGPGESSMFEDADGWWIAYAPNAAHTHGTKRPLAVAPVAFGPDGPYLAQR